MSCNSPNKIFYLGNDKFGKRITAFCSRHTDFLILKSDMTYEKMTGDPAQAHVNLGEKVITDCDLVPCGQCIGCRIDYSRSWAARLMLEKKKFPDNECFFITLTYDDEHLPKFYESPEREIRHVDKSVSIAPSDRIYTVFPQKDWVEIVPEIIDNDGTYIKTPFNSVSKRDHQLFLKRLRDKFGNGLRFFCSLEYGDKSLRPHMHYIVFGLKDFPIGSFTKSRIWYPGKPYKQNFRGDALYESYALTGPTGCWTDSNGYPIGRALVSRVTFDTCNYVTRYIVKKRKKIGKEWYDRAGIEPEQCFMSRRPGLGKEYFLEHYDDFYKTDSLSLPGSDGAFTLRPPKYFDTLLDKVDPGLLWVTKQDRRAMAEFAEDFREFQYPTLDLEDIYSAREHSLSNKISQRKESSL